MRWLTKLRERFRGKPAAKVNRYGIAATTAAEDQAYRDEIDARAAGVRAERAAVLAALLDDRPRWLGHRGRWLR